MAFNKSSKSSTGLRISYKKIRSAKNSIQNVTNIKAFLCIQNTETAVMYFNCPGKMGMWGHAILGKRKAVQSEESLECELREIFSYF